jgi:hypothetical protein
MRPSPLTRDGRIWIIGPVSEGWIEREETGRMEVCVNHERWTDRELEGGDLAVIARKGNRKIVFILPFFNDRWPSGKGGGWTRLGAGLTTGVADTSCSALGRP